MSITPVMVWTYKADDKLVLTKHYARIDEANNRRTRWFVSMDEAKTAPLYDAEEHFGQNLIGWSKYFCWHPVG